MIRFCCPICGKVLKVADEKAGKVVVCLRCEERVVAPARANPLVSAAEDVGTSRGESPLSAGPPGLLSGMSWETRCLVALSTAIVVFNLVLTFLPRLLFSRESVPETTATWHVVLALCSLVILLVILYGQATVCPRCRQLWARTKVVSEFVDWEVFDKHGVPLAKSLFRTTYQCGVCRHRWSVMQADEYLAPARKWDRPHSR